VLLKNKVAAISGAAGLRGIGFATAKLFAEQGARVAILDIDAAAAETAASSLGGGHLGLRCDVSKKAECESAIKEVIAKTGQLDILINNAGITQALNVWDIDDDSWNRMLDVNLRGVLYLSQAAIPHMREKKAGSIVCTASGAVHSGGGFVGTAHYCASKGGVIALGRAMARELGPFGIRVNCIAPGLIQTDINAARSQTTRSRTSSVGHRSGVSASRRISRTPSSTWRRTCPTTSRGRSSMSTAEFS
jgi:NAD(P)-dependent dehydrogenase (short-subunit alcohol dehydrogenase family)